MTVRVNPLTSTFFSEGWGLAFYSFRRKNLSCHQFCTNRKTAKPRLLLHKNKHTLNAKIIYIVNYTIITGATEGNGYLREKGIRVRCLAFCLTWSTFSFKSNSMFYHTVNMSISISQYSLASLFMYFRFLAQQKACDDWIPKMLYKWYNVYIM